MPIESILDFIFRTLAGGLATVESVDCLADSVTASRPTIGQQSTSSRSSSVESGGEQPARRMAGSSQIRERERISERESERTRE